MIIKWGDEDLPDLEQLVLNWIQLFPRDVDTSLTTFMRVGVVDPGGDRVVIGGRYLGTKSKPRKRWLVFWPVNRARGRRLPAESDTT